MVKSVVGEETRLKSAENRLFRSSIPSEIGLVVGKLNPNSDRGFVYDLIPTPPTDGGLPACSLKSEGSTTREDKKRGSKGGKASNEPPPSISIDVDWVSEHARQASRMLMGGMSVVGIYLWASEASFKATSPSILSQALSGIAQTAPMYDCDYDERMLIHISYSPSRWACRNCTVASGNMRPCDFKMGKLLASLQTYRCMYNFELRLPIFNVGASDFNTFKNVLRSGIARHAKELQSAKALIDGNLETEVQSTTSEGIHEVELLLPFMEDAFAEACSSNEVAGLVTFMGTVCASSYLGPKEPVSQAVSDLKGDIIKSLQSRLDIVMEAAEDKFDLTSNSGHEVTGEMLAGKSIHQLVLPELRVPYCFSLPRRVLVPWLAGIFICDYLQPLESFEDLKDRCKEMMSMESPIDSAAIVEPEAEATSVMAKSFWDVIHGCSLSLCEPKNAGTSTGGDVSGKSPANLHLLTAVLIALVALLVGWATMFPEQMKSVH